MHQLPPRQSKLGSLLAILLELEAVSDRLKLQKLFKASLLLAIRIYQRYLSPYKGFACAYRVLHQEQSCSHYFYSCITEQSFACACRAFQQRLVDCRQANIVLRSSSRDRSKQRRRRKRENSCLENNNCFRCSDLVDEGLLLSFCNPFALLDCGDCDF